MGYVGPGVIRRLRARFPDAELIGFDSGYFAHNLTGTLRLPETLLDRLHFGDIRHFPPRIFLMSMPSSISPQFPTTRWARSLKTVTEAINERA